MTPTPPTTPHRPRGLAIGFALLLCLAASALAGCRQAQEKEPFHPVVRTTRIRLSESAGGREFSGVVVARHEVQESFRVGGRITRRSADVGDRVKKGQVLAVLDDMDLRLSMESAKAELQAAASNKTQALADERRYAALLGKKVISQSEYDLKQLAADEASARLDKAVRALALAKNRFDYARLVSETSGVVSQVNAEAGQVVAPGQSVVTVATNGEMEVLVDIPENLIGKLDTSAAEASLWGHEGAAYKAVLRETAPSADPATRTYTVKFTLIAPGPEVRLGMTATLRLSTPQAMPTACIPATALFDQGRGAGVWKVDPDTGHVRFGHVAIDRYAGQSAYVHGQIADGDVIVTAGVQKLDPSMVVRMEEAAKGVCP